MLTLPGCIRPGYPRLRLQMIQNHLISIIIYEIFVESIYFLLFFFLLFSAILIIKLCEISEWAKRKMKTMGVIVVPGKITITIISTEFSYTDSFICNTLQLVTLIFQLVTLTLQNLTKLRRKIKWFKNNKSSTIFRNFWIRLYKIYWRYIEPVSIV